MFYVEAAPAKSGEWRPIHVVFGAGRYEVQTRADAQFEVGLWTVPARQRGYEVRLREGAKAPVPKTVEKAKKESDYARALKAKADAKAQAESNLLKARKPS